MPTNKQYTSSVFSLLFGEKEHLLELYNAIEGTSFGPETEIEINTLEKALYMDRYNDISFTIQGRYVVLFEHQSSINENMPLRALLYIGRIYEKLINNKAIYQEKLMKIPAPEFYVLYNGVKEYPHECTQKLSDAFLEHSGALELKVRVININYSDTSKVLEKSQTLKGYSYFINCAREYRLSGMSLKESVELSVHKCIDEGVLRKFLENHASEVVNMLFTEFKLEDALQVKEQEGKMEGIKSVAQNLLSTNLSIEEIAQATGLTRKEIEELRILN